MDVTRADPGLLEDLADLAARCQADPNRYVAYVSDDAEAIAADIAGVEDWPSVTWVALEQGDPAGWLLAESDAHLGRIWWWGPFVADEADWESVADLLYLDARPAVSRLVQEEIVADSRSSNIPALAERHGFHREEGSLLLVRTLEDTWPLFHEVVRAEPDHHEAVIALHDRLFPNTHTPGSELVTKDAPSRILLVAMDAETVAGYVAAEIQNDGSLYIDFLGVDPRRARMTFGRKLVATVCALGSERGAPTVHLSVRESNDPAHALYESSGFVVERLVVPYRKGFSLT